MRDRPTQLIQRPEPEPERPRGGVSPWTMVAAGIGGLVVGLIIGTVFQVAQEDEAPAVEPIAAVAQETSAPDATAAPLPPTSSPDVVAAPAPLDELVPDLEGCHGSHPRLTGLPLVAHASTARPAAAEATDADKMPSLAALISESSNARSAMNSAIVKPIPASRPAPASIPQPMSGGRLASPERTASHPKVTIPTAMKFL